MTSSQGSRATSLRVVESTRTNCKFNERFQRLREAIGEVSGMRIQPQGSHGLLGLLLVGCLST
ncbi:MAG: hypothetical protein M3M98_08020, partial [Nitrospirota bacterium]|nr:hypothetical protein [Nitrospirota bacterium]